MNEFLIYCPQHSQGSHIEHARALSNFTGMRCTTSFRVSFKWIMSGRAIYLQKSSVTSTLLLVWAVICSSRTLFYVHEPLNFLERRRKGVAAWKALTLFFQLCIDSWCANVLLTGNQKNRTFLRQELFYFPLLFDEINSSASCEKRENKVIYFGRPDELKYYSIFKGFKSDIFLDKSSDTDGDRITYTIEQKREVFCRFKYFWGVHANYFTQSGVSAEAVHNGAILITSEDDPLIEHLSPSNYVAISKSMVEEEIVESINRHEKNFRGLCKMNIFGYTKYQENWKEKWLG